MAKTEKRHGNGVFDLTNKQIELKTYRFRGNGPTGVGRRFIVLIRLVLTLSKERDTPFPCTVLTNKPRTKSVTKRFCARNS